MFSLLYVDDEPGLLELGKIFLESDGEFQVITALSGEVGLRHLASQDFDAIVSDYQMPEMNGLEFLKRVRKSFGTIPFILFTGRGREEVVIEAINMGVDFYLQKGGDPKAQFAELALKIRQAVNRRLAETALSDSERRLADIINFLPDATFAIDTRGVVIAWNRAMEQMTGVRSDDVLGKGNYEYALPFYHERRPLLIDIVLDDDPAIVERYPFVKREEKTLFSEITIPHFNEGRGAALWFTASPLFNRKGEIAGAIESIREITERKQAEESLVSANREYTNLLSQIQDIYYRSDTEGRLVRASRSWATLLGYDDVAECIGKNIADEYYVNPSDRERFLEEIYQNGKVTGYEVLLKKKDGTPVVVEASSHLNYDTAGNVIGIEGTFRDITARKKAEEELRTAYEQLTANEEELKEQYNELAQSERRIRESEQKYRTVFENTGTAMLMIEGDTTISLVNSEFSRLSGYSREEIENRKKWTEFVVAEDLERMITRHRQRRADRDSALKRYEFRFVTRSGEIREILLSIDIIPGTAKSVASLLDITEKKKTTDELQAANEQLIASDEELRAQYDELALSEKQIRLSERRLSFMLGFFEYAKKSEKELLGYAIEGAGIVTGSPLGYLAFLNGDESELSMYAWSKNAMAECSMIEKPIIYKTEKTGLWGEAVRQRRPVITNDYAAPDPAKKGYPKGHPHIIRHMNVPVIDDGHIVLVAGVANKPSDYTENDTSELILLMKALWTIIKRKRVQEEQKAADEQLKKSEEALRMLKISVDQSADEIFWLDFEGNILYVNDAACRSNGYTRDEFLTMKIYELNPDLSREIWLGSVTDLREKKTQLFTTRHMHRDGNIIDVEIMSVYVNQDGREYSFAFVRDITDRKNAQTKLQAAYEQVTAADEELREQYDNLAAAQARISSHKQQLEEIASTIPGVVYQFYARPDGRRGMYYTSARSLEIFGIEPDLEKFFPLFTSCIHPDDRAGFLASIDDVIKQQSDWHFEGRFNKPSGESLWFEGISSPVTRGGELVFTGVILDITDRKRAETALLDSERKYRTLFETANEGIWTIDAEFRTVSANMKMQEMFGYTEQEMMGRTVWDFVLPGEAESMKQELFKRPHGIPGRYERRWVRKDGTVIWCFTSATPVFSPDGTFIGSFGMFTDITERRQMDEALRESEEKYRTLVESSFDGIAIHQDGILVYVNRTAARLLGADDPEVFIGKPALELVAPELRPQIADRVQQGDKNSQKLIREQFLRVDGTAIDVDVTTTPCTWKGRPAAYVTFRDITAQVCAEEALRESEEKYRMLVERSRDGVFIIQDGRLVFYNKALTGLAGYTTEDLDNRPLTELVAPEDQEMVISRARDRILGREVPDQYEFSLLHKDKNHRIRVRVSAGQGSYKGRPASIGMFYDVTEDRRREEALRESEEKFRALVESTSDFIWEVDTAGKYTYVSPQVHGILGYEPEELKGMTPFDLMPAEEAERVADEFNRYVTSRLPITGLENKALRKDGSVVILETSGIVRTAEDGSYLGYRGIDRDITKRKKAEQALHEKTEELNRFFTATLDLFCIAGTDGYFRRLNLEWEKALGYSLEELEGHRFLDFIHPDDYQSTLAAVADLAAQKSVINFTNRYRHKDGTYRWIEWRSLPVGALIFAAARDITARHDAAERTERISALKQDLLRTARLEEKLKRITDGVVDIFGADFARIWMSGPGDLCNRGCIHAATTNGAHACRDRANCLHLIVSSGRYTHTGGGHRRVPFGAYKIGRIATGDEAMFITNNVTHDPRVHDHAWAESLGLKSFAGFRLVSPEGTPVGVLAFFSRQSVLPEVMDDLSDLATTASQVIQTGMAEQALQESEARLSSILQGSPVLQFVIDGNHRVISWNTALEEYSGIRAADIIGTDMQWRAFYPEKRPVLADLLVDGDTDAVNEWYTGKFKKSRYIEGAYEVTDFFPGMGSSGTWLSFTAAPIRDAGGRIIGAVETLEDVTERMNAENALRESEERTRTILNTAQAGIILVDAETHAIIDANSKALELIGLPRESVIGSVCHRFICPADEGKCPVTDSGQQVDTSERVLIAADGSQIPVLKTVVPVTLADRNILVESFVDISGHKRSEAAIREANRKLNLLSSITRHDVANQLAAVQGYTQLAALKKPGPAVADYLGRIASAVETIQHQIEFTKEYQELGVHAPGWFGVGDVIRGARPKNVRLRCTCDPFEVFADPMIGRVFFNLFDNAIRYGGKVTTITAGCKTRGNELVIVFSDNGIGIPPGEKEKIFEKGYGKNTGFGLFLAREILAITGITIHETGKQGKGARFEIIVPKGTYRNKE